MNETRIVEYQDDELNVRLVVTRVDIRAGMIRTRLQLQADAEPSNDQDVQLLKRFTYPDLIAATTEASGIPWPLSFDDYLHLPERLGLLWERAVYDLNPHWVPGWEERVAAEKKASATPSTDG